MDIVVNINVESGKAEPKVVIKKKPAVKKTTGGVVQFPEMSTKSNPILDMMGIKET